MKSQVALTILNILKFENPHNTGLTHVEINVRGYDLHYALTVESQSQLLYISSDEQPCMKHG